MSWSPEPTATTAINVALDLLRTSSNTERIYKTGRDYATTADFAIEDAVRDLLTSSTPDIGFLGEERGHTGNTERYWCLDPIDGTTNYTHGLPNYGVALALIEDGQPTFGIVALPAHGERYITRDGVVLNDAPVTVSATDTLSEAVVSVGDFATGTGSVETNRRRIATIARLANTVARVRMLGSAATDLAWLAAGRLDAVVIDANKPWDMAAGVAIARAAGATITHADGAPYTLAGPDLIAAAPHVHARLLAVVASLDSAPDCLGG